MSSECAATALTNEQNHLAQFKVPDRVRKLGTDYAPIRAIPAKPRSALRGRVGGAMPAIGRLCCKSRKLNDAENLTKADFFHCNIP
jgi:hypothetical protein